MDQKMDPGKRETVLQMVQSLWKRELNSFVDLKDGQFYIHTLNLLYQFQKKVHLDRAKDRLEYTKTFLQGIYGEDRVEKYLNFHLLESNPATLSQADEEFELAKIALVLYAIGVLDKNHRLFVEPALRLPVTMHADIRALIQAVVQAGSVEMLLTDNIETVLRSQSDDNYSPPLGENPKSVGASTPKDSRLLTFTPSTNNKDSHWRLKSVPLNNSLSEITSPLKDLTIDTASPDSPFLQFVQSPQVIQKATINQKDMENRKLKQQLMDLQYAKDELQDQLHDQLALTAQKDAENASMKERMKKLVTLQDEVDKLEELRLKYLVLESECTKLTIKVADHENCKEQITFLERISDEQSQELDKLYKEVRLLDIEREKNAAHAKNIAKLESEIKKLHSNLAESSQSTDAWTRERNAILANLEQAKQLNNVLRQELDECQANRNDNAQGECMGVILEIQIKEIRSELDALRSERDGMQLQINDMKRIMDDKDKEIAWLKSKVEELSKLLTAEQTMTQTQKDDIIRLVSQLSTAEGQLQVTLTSVELLEGEVLAMEQSKAALKVELESTQADYTAVRQEKKELLQGKDILAQEVASLKSQLDEAFTDSAILQDKFCNDISELKLQIVSKDQEIAEKKLALEKANVDLTLANDAIQSLTDSSSNVTATSVNLEIQVNQLSRELEVMKAALSEQKKQVESKQADYTAVLQEKNDLLESKEILAQEVASLKRQLDAASLDSSSLQDTLCNDINELKLQIVSKDQELAEKKLALEKANVDLTLANDAIQSLTDSSSNATATSVDLEIQVNQLSRELEVMNAALGEQEKQVESTQADYTAVLQEKNDLLEGKEILAQEVANLKRQLDAASLDSSSLQDKLCNDISELKLQIVSKDQELAEKKLALEKANVDLTLANDAIQRLTDSSSNATATSVNLEIQANQLSRELKVMKAVLGEQEEQADLIKADYTAVLQEKNDLLEGKDILAQEVASLKSQLDEAFTDSAILQDKFCNDISELKLQIVSKDQEIAEKKLALEKANVNLTLANDAIQSLTDSSSNATATSVDLEIQVNQLSRELEVMKAALGEQEKQVESTQADYRAVLQEKNDLLEGKEILAQEVANLKRRLDATSLDSSSLQDKLCNDISELKLQIVSKDQELAEKKLALEKANVDLTLANDAIQSLTDSSSNATATSVKLEIQVNQLSRELEVMKAALSEQEKQVESKEADYTAVLQEKNDLSESKEILAQEVASLKRQLDAASLDSSSLQDKLCNDISELKLQIVSKDQELAEKKLALEKTNVDLTLANDAIQSLTDSSSNATATSVDLEIQVNQLSRELEVMNAALGEQEKQVESTQADYRAVLQEKNDLLEGKEILAKEVANLKRQLDAASLDSSSLQDKLCNDISELKLQIVSKDQELAEKKLALEKANVDLTLANDAIQSLKDSSSNATATSVDLEIQVNQLSRELEVMKAALGEQEKQVESTQADYTAVLQEKNDLLEGKEILAQEVANLKRQLDAASLDSSSLQDKLCNDISELKFQIVSKDQELAEKKLALEKANVDLTLANDAIQSLTDSSSNATATIVNLEIQVNQLSRELEVMNAALGEQEKQVESTQADYTAVLQEKNDLLEGKEILAQEVANLKRQLDVASLDSSSLQDKLCNDISELKLQIVSKDQELAEKKLALEKANVDLTLANEAIQSLTDSSSNATATIVNLEIQVNQLSRELEVMNAALGEQEKQVESTQADYTAVLQEKNDLLEGKEILAQEVANLKRQLDAASLDSSSLQDKLCNDISELKLQIVSKDQELAEKKLALEKANVDLTLANDAIQSLTDSSSNATATSVNLEIQVNRLSRELEVMNAALGEQEKQVESTQADYRAVLQEKNDLLEGKEILAQEVANLKRQLDAASLDSSSLQDKLCNDISELKLQIVSKDQELAEKNLALEKANVDLTLANDAIQSLTDSSSNATATSVDLEIQANQLSRELEVMKAALGEQEKQVESIQAHYTAILQDKNDLLEGKEILAQEVASLKRQLDAASLDSSSLQDKLCNDISELKLQIVSKDQELAEKKLALEKANVDLTLANEAIQSLTDSSSNATATIVNLEIQVNQLSRELEVMNAALGEQEKQVESTQADYTAVLQEKNDLLEGKEILAQEVANLKRQLDAASLDSSSLQDKLCNDISELKLQIVSKDQELAEKKLALEKANVDLTLANDAIQSLTDSSSNATATSVNLEIQVNQLSRELEVMNAALGEQEKQVESTQADYRAVLQEKNDLLEGKEILAQEVANLKRQLDAASLDSSSLQDKLCNDISELKLQIVSKDQELAEKNLALEKANVDLTLANDAIQSLTDSSSNATATSVDLEIQANQLSRELEVMKAALGEQEKQVESIQAHYTAILQDKNDLLEGKEILAQEVASLKRQLDAASLDSFSLQDKLCNDISELKLQIVSKDQELAEQKLVLEKANLDLTKLSEMHNEECMKRIHHLEAEVNRYKKMIKTLQEEAVTLREREKRLLNECDVKIAKAKEFCNDLRRQLVETNQKLEESKKETKQLTENSERAELSLQKMKTANESLSKAVKLEMETSSILKKRTEAQEHKYEEMRQKLETAQKENKNYAAEISRLKAAVDYSDRKIREYKHLLDPSGIVHLGDSSHFRQITEQEEPDRLEESISSVHSKRKLRSHTASDLSFHASSDETILTADKVMLRRETLASTTDLTTKQTTGKPYQTEDRLSLCSVSSAQSIKSKSEVPVGFLPNANSCANEPEDLDFEWDRLNELQRRNTLYLPHMKSAYPVELQTSRKRITDDSIRLSLMPDGRGKASPGRYNTRQKDNTTRAGYGEPVKNDQMAVKRKALAKQGSDEQSFDESPAKQRKSDLSLGETIVYYPVLRTAPVYQRPGPPTPGKQPRRISGRFTPSHGVSPAVNSKIKALGSPIARPNPRLTPGKKPSRRSPRLNSQQAQSSSSEENDRRQSVAFNVGFTPGKSKGPYGFLQKTLFGSKNKNNSKGLESHEAQADQQKKRKPLTARNFLETGI